MGKALTLSFDEFYQNLWHQDWPHLKASLLKPTTPFERPNAFYPLSPHNLKEFYSLDIASLYPVKALNLCPEDKVLDMCAAPGGKSLLCLEALKDPTQLVLNEFSTNRRYKLLRVLNEYVPKNIFQNIRITGFDGARIGLYQNEAYDKILLDAPCSSERHVLQSDNALSEWTPMRSKNLVKKQYALLTSALLALKPKGVLVYSTCSISNLENDGVIQKLCDKKTNVQPIPLNYEIGSPTRFGWQILPHQDNNAGPMYFCALTKT